jgi:pimeloyl-ACP methyl ester carboxylesterase
MTKAFGETAVTVEIAGSAMNVIDAGKGDVVVLGHGYLWNAEMWRPQIDVLSRHYRVIVPNLWGHGGSGPLPGEAANLRDIARHHLALIDRLDVERFTLVGLSVGGMWGTELALLAPKRVTELVLMGTFVGVEPEVTRHRNVAMLNAVAATSAMPGGVLDAIVPMFFSSDVASRSPHLPRNFRNRLAGWDRDRLLDSVLPLGRMILGRRDMLADLSRLFMPAMVMTGAEDSARPVHEGRQMAEALGCRFIELPGAGHISSLETPDAVNQHLLRFLAEVRAQPRRQDRP